MLILFNFLTALVVALIFMGLLYLVIGPDSGGSGWGWLLFLFFILFFPIWAGGLWLRPIGAPLSGVPIFSFLFIGLLIALIVAAVSKANKPKHAPASAATTSQEDAPRLPREQLEADRRAEGLFSWRDLFGLFFWLIVIYMIFAIVFAIFF